MSSTTSSTSTEEPVKDQTEQPDKSNVQMMFIIITILVIIIIVYLSKGAEIGTWYSGLSSTKWFSNINSVRWVLSASVMFFSYAVYQVSINVKQENYKHMLYGAYGATLLSVCLYLYKFFGADSSKAADPNSHDLSTAYYASGFSMMSILSIVYLIYTNAASSLNTSYLYHMSACLPLMGTMYGLFQAASV
jgi:hypothetical protein